MIGPLLSRRQWLRATGQSTLLGTLRGHALAQGEQREPTLAPLNRSPRMMQDWYVQQVRGIEKVGKAVRGRLKTRADALEYIRSVRERIADCFGPFPEKSPLNPRVTGKLERDTYRIEKVVFESRPGFFVTANLYVPKAGNGPWPGVVGSCGHAHNGKADPAYQSFCQGLARLGYVVLIFDPIGQGERLQYAHLEKSRRPGPGVEEHLLAGNQQFLVGEFFGAWRAWDGIRALDYLLTRPEVDPKHVGITGNSGGGTMTTWLCGLETRWTMAAPGCFVTTIRRNLENELPQDTEQCPPRVLAAGLDHADFLACLAPKPVIILAKEKDYFDVRGAEEAYQRLVPLYALLGAPDNVKLHVGPSGHGYSIENREAMYQWFNRVTGVSDAKQEPKLTLEKDEDLRCTARGSVTELRSRSVFSFTAETAQRLAASRTEPTTAELIRRLRAALKLPSPQGPPEYRILRPISGRKYPKPHATPYAIETEEGIFAFVYRLADQVHYSRPPKGQEAAILYVSHHSADVELRDEPLIPAVMNAEPQATLYAMDVRGVGESRPDTCGGPDRYLTAYGSDYFYAIHGVMLDRPYPGQRTFDVLRVLDWLTEVGHTSVHLVAKGWGTIPGTFASVLSDRVTRVTLKHPLTSFSAVARSETYSWPLSSFVPGVLREFDLDDCYRVLGAKKLQTIEPWGPTGKPG
jgi:dienelactone hydrolase